MEEKEKEKESSVIQLADFKIQVVIHQLPQAVKDLHSAEIRLEAHGVSSKQAEAITAAITGVLNESLETVSHSFVSKVQMQKTEMIQDSNLSKFQSEVQSSQKHHVSLLQRETEKFRGDIEKMCNELKYEIDKSFNMSNDKDNLNVADLTTILNDEDRVGLVHALKTKLQSLNGQHYELLKNLSSTVRKCVEDLRGIQSQHDELEAKFLENNEVLAEEIIERDEGALNSSTESHRCPTRCRRSEEEKTTKGTGQGSVHEATIMSHPQASNIFKAFTVVDRS